MPTGPARRFLATAAALLGALALLLTGCSLPSAGTSAVETPPTVAAGTLPAEARETLRLIDAGGPFPYAKDGTVFHNFEGILPSRPSDYYREYTVPTPGAPDRGARRIVAGAGGEIYYTDDHYKTFRAVRR
ncbi:ribonuclease N1 [Actinacidiphila glaucinigra]|uniref:ribonuclease domain-containing protein n=1 Tax=Actinacidiphila glaucinigra TaxID=235986 RepID=UPI002DDA4990|nr:ribonuclease domain-containing protein [Actinacidiphila glaucinigra]WSD63238.1 ribonuclease N1 [Actinacidiphila glaucinigra]